MKQVPKQEYTVEFKVQAVKHARSVGIAQAARDLGVVDRMTANIVTDALRMAWFRRKPDAGVLFHSDRSSQYASHAVRTLLTEYGMIASMSRKGNCWDNAPTESFFNSLKNERVYGTRYATREQAQDDLFEYIEVFYNRTRRHSSLGYLSPIQFLDQSVRKQPEQIKLAA